MELILSSAVLTLVLLVGGIVEFLVTASSRQCARQPDMLSGI
jgi:hypothetical protein